jgi:hypothetical protein
MSGTEDSEKILPEDVKESWLRPIRATQAACTKNRGLAWVTINVLVYKNDAVRWSEPRLTKIHPARIGPDNTNADILAMLIDVDQVDNT